MSHTSTDDMAHARHVSHVGMSQFKYMCPYIWMNHAKSIWTRHVSHVRTSQSKYMGPYIWMSHVKCAWTRHVSHIWMRQVKCIWTRHVSHVWLSQSKYMGPYIWMSHYKCVGTRHVAHVYECVMSNAYEQGKSCTNKWVRCVWCLSIHERVMLHTHWRGMPHKYEWVIQIESCRIYMKESKSYTYESVMSQYMSLSYEFDTSSDTATHCNTLQHTATHCNTLQHTATHSTHCNTLQHTATHCNTLQHTATHCNTLQHTVIVVRIGHVLRHVIVIWMRQVPNTSQSHVSECVAVCCSVLQQTCYCHMDEASP